MAEVQDVFLASFEEYGMNHFVPLQAQKAAKAIMECRTQALGGHTDVCTKCGYTHQSYNSCRNRNCPKCQTVKKEQWIGKRKQDMLDVKHFHTVFTIPSELNALVLQNQCKLYGLLFTASAGTVKELTADPKYLGASVGFMSILHSWGSNMSFHPHIHMVATAGGIAPDGRWKPTRGKYFLPVKVLSSLFRGKFLSGCRALYDRGELSLKGDNGNAVSRNAFSSLIDACYQKDWVVYSKVPFNGAEGVLLSGTLLYSGICTFS
jgi:predicted Zn-ribbon and HTH transcriptional regulator